MKEPFDVPGVGRIAILSEPGGAGIGIGDWARGIGAAIALLAMTNWERDFCTKGEKPRAQCLSK